MDIYEYLKKDHERVDQLFKEFEDVDDDIYRAEIVERLTEELVIHAESEEKTFYKFLKKFGQAQDKALHSEEEHEDIVKQLSAIAASEQFSDDWIQHVLKLKQIVQHHVKEEEEELFTKAKKVLSEEDAYKLKEKMHNYKESMVEKYC